MYLHSTILHLHYFMYNEPCILSGGCFEITIEMVVFMWKLLTPIAL